MKKYQIVYADPPWDYGGSGFPSTGVASAYPLMSTAEICALPVRNIGHEHAVLFLWAVMSQLPAALEVMEAWGFEYVTNGFTWVKTYPKEGGYVVGMGYWTRQNAELCLVGKRGTPQRNSRSVPSVVVSPRMEHSRKPDIVRTRIVRVCGHLPRIELFARTRAVGWDVWGNEVESDVCLKGWRPAAEVGAVRGDVKPTKFRWERSLNVP